MSSPALSSYRSYIFIRPLPQGFLRQRAFVNVPPVESRTRRREDKPPPLFQYDQIVTIPVTVPSPRRGMLYSGTTDKTDQSVLEVAIWKSCEWKTCPRCTARATRRSRRWTGYPFQCRRASSSPSSARPARVNPPCCTFWAAWTSPPPARYTSTMWTFTHKTKPTSPSSAAGRSG